MPELPEVETFVREMRAPCIGQRITDVTVTWARHIATPSPKQLRDRIKNQTIKSITRRAKYLVFQLSRDYLLIHLKMSGELYVYPAKEPRHKHDRTIFHFANKKELRFRDQRKFGKVYLVADPAQVTGHLGYEPLEKTFTLKIFAALLQAHQKPLKPFLLDQTYVVGIGNIYADESLHLAKLHPKRLCNSLRPPEVKALWQSIRRTLNTAIKNKGSSIDNLYRYGEHQDHFRVYDRTDEPCYTCGRPIQRITFAGRGTHFCKHCQRL